MILLLDCDVLLDVALNRQPHFDDSRSILDWCEQHPGAGVVAWHTLANIFYIFSKDSGAAAAKEFIEDLLGFIEVAAVQTAQAKHALALAMPDFEDGLQVAAAVSAGADFIVTRNVGDYAGSPIAARTPTTMRPLLPGM
jgi:predicted nucleic acid-binding protein